MLYRIVSIVCELHEPITVHFTEQVGQGRIHFQRKDDSCEALCLSTVHELFIYAGKEQHATEVTGMSV